LTPLVWTLAQAEWGPITIAREVSADQIAHLNRQPGKDIVLFAGASIASAFAHLDLFDEYRLMIHPIVLGAGVPLFAGLYDEQVEAAENGDLAVWSRSASVRARSHRMSQRRLMCSLLPPTRVGRWLEKRVPLK
jgi:dihydrofolate reductase